MKVLLYCSIGIKRKKEEERGKRDKTEKKESKEERKMVIRKKFNISRYTVTSLGNYVLNGE